MKVDMRKIDEWLDEAITFYIGDRRDGRCLEYDLYEWLNPSETTAHFIVMCDHHPEWMSISKQKRTNRIRKALDVMLRDHRIEIRNESGDPSYSEGHTRYIYILNVLDRIAAHLGDD